MPGTTANRGYPYPVNTDPLNVAVDIERLAEAIDFDVTNVAAPTALVIRPWTADAGWGSLAHPAMQNTEVIVMARGAQPTIVSSWAGQPVQIRYGPTDAAHMLQVGTDHRFTGGTVYQMTGDSHFMVPPLTNSEFGDHTGSAFYRPRDSANNTHMSNTTGGHIYVNAWATHFRWHDGTHDVCVMNPSADRVDINGKVFWPGGGGGLTMADTVYVRTTDGKGLSSDFGNFQRNGNTTWSTQQLMLQAGTGTAGLSFVVHQNAWAVIARANPTSTLAPCLDIVTSETQGYANIAAGNFVVINVFADEADLQPMVDGDLLTQVAMVEGVSWKPPLPLDINGEVIQSPNLDARTLGLTAPALHLAFPDAVALDEASEPFAINIGQVATVALAAAGALQRKIVDLETRLAALEV